MNELHTSTDGNVACPLRGEIPVEWCVTCPYEVRIERRGRRALVVCDSNASLPRGL